MVPQIYITAIPLEHKTYYQWLIYGMYKLQQQGKLKLSFSRMPLRDKLSHKSARFCKIANKYLGTKASDSSYCLQGYILSDNLKKYFCYDIADSPFLYDLKLLHKVDYYFKAQCPKEISNQGFPLSSQIRIPFHKDVLSLKYKILPAMIGPRCLYTGCIFDFEKIDEIYQKMAQDKVTNKTRKLMCYFGSALGPISTTEVHEPNFNSESDILGHFKEKINHPNEKRAIAAEFISRLGPEYDSRLINTGNSDSSNKTTERTELIIPLSDFCRHISNFQYNLNISGYRNSIPNRFIESFLVGTGILTDKLFVKWYHPFGHEVYESTEMSYLPMQDVNWKQFKEDITNLPPISANEILDIYNRKWSPIAFAEYVVNKMKD